MSRIRTNLITNRMANGAPTVSNGLVISGVTTATTLDVNGTSDFSGDAVFNSDVDIVDAIVHVGDTDTKIRFPAADTISFETAGSEVLSMNLDGLVTGGQTNPTSSDNGNIYIKNGSSIGGVNHAVNYVSNAVFNGAWKYINSGAGATRIVVNQNGYQFDAAASGTAGNNITFTPLLNISNGGAHKITCNQSHFSANLSEMNTGNLALNIIQTRQGQTKGIGFGAIGSANENTGIQAYDTSDNSANPLLINPFGGNIIIGDTNTNNAFSGGDSLVIGNTSSGTRSGITLVCANDQDGGLYFSDGTSSGNANVQGQVVYDHSGSFMRFYTAASERVRITATGHTLFSGLTAHNDSTRNVTGITVKSTGGVSFQNYGSNGSRNWRIRPDDMSRWGDLDFSVSPTSNSSTDWPDAAADKVMTLGYDGSVTKPRQPSFQATRSGAGAIQIASNSGADVIFTSEEWDVGSNYNNSNGRFTAPVAGKYFFGIQLYLGFSVTAVRVMHSYFGKNGSSNQKVDLCGGINSDGGTHYHPTAAGTCMMNLAVGDYVTFNLGSPSFSGSGNSYLYDESRFFGYLVG